MIYLDSCALVKLIRDEDGSEALQAWLDERPDEVAVTSGVVRAEVLRVVRRGNHDDQGVVDPDALVRELGEAASLLEIVAQVAVDDRLLDAAGALRGHPHLSHREPSAPISPS